MLSRAWDSCLLVVLAGLTLGCQARPTTSAVPSTAAVDPGPLREKTQLVTVVTSGWNDFQATLKRYERVPGGPWRAVGAPIAAVLGREGYGWGRGLHGEGAPEGRPGPVKQEGDGRSPAGVFGIGTAYGYAPARPEMSIPYRAASRALRCVDDPKSRRYNQIVSAEETPLDWASAEHMRRKDDLYVLAIVVEHNSAPTEAGAGSCIFIHLWNGPDVGMSGCTAVAMPALEDLARWLEPRAALVALPRGEYEALRVTWTLP
jgi:L,D-peptidoglycan transpeptidase YkuD (ErfK/YbiS/YcfS/YnhG family)